MPSDEAARKMVDQTVSKVLKDQGERGATSYSLAESASGDAGAHRSRDERRVDALEKYLEKLVKQKLAARRAFA